MSEKQTKFDIWWNLPETKQKIGAAYSLGASVVIIGAMFKILHLPFAGLMLGFGMSVEAVLFALGVFDKPHKDYEWDKVYDFEGESTGLKSGSAGAVEKAHTPSRSVGLNYTETINDDDVKKLADGIKNLTTTAQQLSSVSSVMGSAEQFAKSMDVATDTTQKYSKTQDLLIAATTQLTNSYTGIADNMETVEKSTKQYVGKIEDINKNLSSINSIYEIQLKNIQAQTEGLTQQTERVHKVNNELGLVLDDVTKMKQATTIVSNETENLKINTTKLSKQIADLNQVYGNMLNALS